MTIHFADAKPHPRAGRAFQFCDGRSVSYDRVTADRNAVTCSRCAAKLERDAAQTGPTLRERIAKALGWTVKDTQSCSMMMLRECVRPVDVRLCNEITEYMRSGRYITGA